ncbi:MAG: hypothetical protein HN976_06750 [Lentisphaerae bacterium]|nr:hypothetical protein [Lentisphaerota bacterium]
MRNVTRTHRMTAGRSCRMGGVAVLSVWCATALSQTVDLGALMQPDVWRSAYKGASSVQGLPDAMGENPGIELVGEKAPEKVTYASITYRFEKPLNLSGLTHLSLFARADQKVQVNMSLDCEGGRMGTGGFLRKALGKSFTKIEFDRRSLQAKGEPDLSRVTALNVGFGLWAFDTTKHTFRIGLAKLCYEGTEDTYIVPLPTRGIAIDGQYKDWGYEDTLYNWYPPDYAHLNDSIHIVPEAGAWAGPAQLSGRFAMMMDDEALYLLALVADASPFEGNNPAAPWKNDSVEVFLAFRTNPRELELGAPMSKAGVQLVFDCGGKDRQPLVFVRGRPAPAKARCTTVPATWTVRGKQTGGYVVEAAVPLEALPIETRERGSLFGYSIKLNDASGLSLVATPKNLKPHATVKDFRRAYIEIKAETGEAIEFGPVARDVLWPERFTPDEGDVRIWDMTRAHRKQVSETTRRLYLHSLWAVQAVGDSAQSPRPDGWSYVPLPMGIGWDTPLFNPRAGAPDELGRELIGTSVLKTDKTFFWYEREFVPDPYLDSGTLQLVFEYVDKELSVYLNGAYVGKVDAMNRGLDVTKHIKHGVRNRLDLLLYTTVRSGYSVRNGTGISGDIYLEHHVQQPTIEDVWIRQASGLDGVFEVVAETASVAVGGRLELAVLSLDGEVLTQVDADVAGSTTTLTGNCPDFQPWSPEHPNLFELRIRIRKADTVIDERVKRFGFRTFEVRNARFMLNGKTLRLRVVHAANCSSVMEPGRLRELKRLGHNSIFMHASHSGYNAPLFETLDEAGFVTLAATDRSWPDPRTLAEVRRYRSHPCVIGYVTDSFGQLDSNGFIHNPFCTSDSYYPESVRSTKELAFFKRRQQLFAAVDPTRPYIPQGTGNFEGSYRAIHHYPCYDLNLLDHMMYFAPWAARPDPQLPQFVYECGVHALYSKDATHPEHTFEVEGGRQVKRMLTYECASRYLGTAAFDNWREWDAVKARATIRGLRICGIDGFTPWITGDAFLQPSNTEKAQDIEDNRALSYTYFMLPFKEVMEDSWMRMNAWYYSLRAQAHWPWPERYGRGRVERTPSPLTPIYENEMQPFFACIAGPPADVFSQAHNYTAGEDISKQIVAVNDTEGDADITFTVAFELEGAATPRTLAVHVPQGAIVHESFTFPVPAVRGKSQGTLRLAYRDPAGRERHDSFPITVFPRTSSEDTASRPWRAPGWGKHVGVVGLAAEDSLMQKMRLPCRPVSLGDAVPSGLDLLVIERGALSGKGAGGVLSAFIEGGGQVLVLEQTGESLLGWRLQERRLESVFIGDSRHPAVAGLEDGDLAYFRDAARIVPAERRPSQFYRHAQSAALETPHLTNEGLVASFVFAKPCYGDFRSILVCGYDLEETALVEMRSGKGRAVFCQVDVTDRYSVDPAATLLVDNIVRWLLTTRPEPRRPISAYVGGERGKAFLDRLGIAAGAGQEADRSVVVVGDGVAPDTALPMVGRTVIVLPFSEWLPPGVTASSVHVQQRDHPHYWNMSWYQFMPLKSLRPAPDRLGKDGGAMFRGLVDNDAYFFEFPELRAYRLDARATDAESAIIWQSRRGTMTEIRQGGIRYVLCSVDPSTFEHGECARKAWRIWSQVFANANTANTTRLRLTRPALDITYGEWLFVTDPDGKGEEAGYPEGRFGDREPRRIRIGTIWEEQGVTEHNPNIASAPDSAYDGFAWYIRKAALPASLAGKQVYLEVGGVRDIWTFNRTANRTDLWINGKKAPEPVGIYNAQQGGRAGRLWDLPAGLLEPGSENTIAIRVYNDAGAGGIHKAPIRFEVPGQNEDMLFPQEFVKSKYTPYFFWCW